MLLFVALWVFPPNKIHTVRLQGYMGNILIRQARMATVVWGLTEIRHTTPLPPFVNQTPLKDQAKTSPGDEGKI